MPAEPGLQFVDTNVLVYAHDRTAGDKRDRAVELLAGLFAEDRCAVSIQVLQEFYVTVSGKLQGTIPAAEAAEIVADLATLRTHAPTGADVLAAIDLRRRLPVSFWDAMILRSAAALGCGVVWSEDLAHGGRYDDVEVRNPFR